jgi:hypothetical protein
MQSFINVSKLKVNLDLKNHLPSYTLNNLTAKASQVSKTSTHLQFCL